MFGLLSAYFGAFSALTQEPIAKLHRFSRQGRIQHKASQVLEVAGIYHQTSEILKTS